MLFLNQIALRVFYLQTQMTKHSVEFAVVLVFVFSGGGGWQSDMCSGREFTIAMWSSLAQQNRKYGLERWLSC